MAKDDSKVEELLRDLIIVQLALAGVPVHEIRKVWRVESRDSISRSCGGGFAFVGY
jgi:hypothetical protein